MSHKNFDVPLFFKRMVVGLWAAASLIGVSTAEAQKAQHPARIGLLTSGRGLGLAEDSFRQGLREQRWVDGQNIVIMSEPAELHLDKLPNLAIALVRRKVAIIVADGEPAIQATKRATTTTPIVFVAVGDPVTEGFVASLARPGGNLTGLTSISGDLSGKRLEILKDVLPKATRVNVLWNPSNASNVFEFQAMKAVAPAIGLQLKSLEVRAMEDLPRALAAAFTERPAALVLIRDPIIDSKHFEILDFAVDKRVLLMHGESQFVEAGGLISYGASRIDLFRRAATYVDKILKGAKPADLPVQQPTKFELIVNLKTAKQIGLAIPPNVLARADRVIR